MERNNRRESDRITSIGRRTFLGLLGTTGVAITAGCSGDDGNGGAEPTDTDGGAGTADFQVSGLDPGSLTVKAGEEISLSATIANEGDAEGTQNVGLRVDGETVDSRSVSLEGTAQTSVSFTVEVDADPGEYEYGVYSEDGSATGPLTVAEARPEQVHWSAGEYGTGETPDESWSVMANVPSFEIMEDDDGQYMHVGAAQEDRSFLRFSEAPEAETVEIRATLKEAAGDNDTWLYMRGQNEDTPDSVSCARVDARLRHGQNRLTEYTNGEDSELSVMDHFAGEGQQYEVRARADGETLQARWWLPDEDEPEEWDLEASTDVTEPGFTGIGHWSGEDFRVYQLGFGRDGAKAPSE